MSGPSDKAVKAARGVYWEPRPDDAATQVRVALEAAHDPALGLDRSVCLRDVVEALRSNTTRDVDETTVAYAPGWWWVAAFVERKFGPVGE